MQDSNLRFSGPKPDDLNLASLIGEFYKSITIIAYLSNKNQANILQPHLTLSITQECFYKL